MVTDYFLEDDYNDIEFYLFLSDEWDKLRQIAIQNGLTEYLEGYEDDLDSPY